MMTGDYKITFHKNACSPIVYEKSKVVNTRLLIKKLMIDLESGDKIIIERKGR